MITDIPHALRLAQELAQSFVDDAEARPARPRVEPEVFRAHRSLELPAEPRPLDEVMADLRFLLENTPNTAGPRFFNQLFAGRDPAAVLGEVIAAVTNNSMYTYKAGGVHVLLEHQMILRFGERIGWTAPCDGIFTPGGSISNLTAMLVARNDLFPETSTEGSFGRPLRVYTSDQSHYSVERAAMVIGIGRRHVVKVPTDDEGRMQPEALQAAIRADREAGLEPFFVNATSGTTVTGSFDPLRALAAICQAEGVWFHVDAAVGAPLLFSETHRHKLDGIDLADSVTWDAHKLMGVPLTCSVALLREPGKLTRRISGEDSADYLFYSDTDRLNPGRRSLQCGRRNDALKLWTAWQLHGEVGFRDRVETVLGLNHYAAEIVRAHPRMRLVREPTLVTVCFDVHDADPAAICEALYERGEALVGTAQVDGRTVIRLAVLDPEITRADIDVFFAHVLEHA